MVSKHSFLIASLVLTFFAILVNSDDSSSPARLLVEKQVLNKYLVENRDIVVHYNIFNVGGSSAINVHVSDAAFSLSHFDVMGGVLKFTIPRIAPVVVRPKIGIWGRFNFTAGEFVYNSEGTSQVQVGFTSEPGEGYIVSEKEFDKRFSPHYYDWAVFLMMSLSTVLFPYLLWNTSKNKYEALLSSKKSK